MWFTAQSVLPLDALLFTELVPFLRHVLTTFVISECLDCAVQLVLHKSLEPLECTKCITLGPQWQDSPKATEIINECDPVLVPFSRLSGQGTMHI